MTQFGNLYSKYYDLLNIDKDYSGEAAYVDGLIKENIGVSSSILDLGCGTGIHADLLSNKGYEVHGVDLSYEMLQEAEKRRIGKENKLQFSHGNIQDFYLNRKFDVVISLFHVLSYQNSNEELLKVFQVSKNHLSKGGIFIFDFWYGPAVLTSLPVTRVKRLENSDIKVTRVAEPMMNPQTNVTDVSFSIFIEDLKTGKLLEQKETHHMRYLFDTELEIICDKVGFKIKKKYAWMTKKVPNFNSWNVVWIVKV